jgi:hypothetical protein
MALKLGLYSSVTAGRLEYMGGMKHLDVSELPR